MKRPPVLLLILLFQAGCHTTNWNETTASSRPGRGEAANWPRERRLWGSVQEPILASSEPGGRRLREAPAVGTPPGLWEDRPTSLQMSRLHPSHLQPATSLGLARTAEKPAKDRDGAERRPAAEATENPEAKPDAN
jgi:hypothetical protein